MGSGDIWINRGAVLFLGLAALTAIIGGCIITIHHGDVPPWLSTQGGAAITALGIIATYGRAFPSNNGGDSGRANLH